MNKIALLIILLFSVISCKENKIQKNEYEKFSFKNLKFSFYLPVGYEMENNDFGSMVLNFSNSENNFLKFFSLTIVLKNEFNELEELQKLKNSILAESRCELIKLKKKSFSSYSKNRKFILLKRNQYNFLRIGSRTVYFLLIKDKKSKLVFFFTFYFENSCPHEIKNEILNKIFFSLKCN